MLVIRLMCMCWRACERNKTDVCVRNRTKQNRRELEINKNTSTGARNRTTEETRVTGGKGQEECARASARARAGPGRTGPLQLADLHLDALQVFDSQLFHLQPVELLLADLLSSI
jgi:hypothetical protein